MFVDGHFRFGNEAGEITSSHITLNESAPAYGIATDLCRSILDRKIGKSLDRYVPSPRIGNLDSPYLLEISSPFGCQAHPQRKSPLPLKNLSNVDTSDRLHDIENGTGIDPMPSQFLSFDAGL
jgi:hypothetical protein